MPAEPERTRTPAGDALSELVVRVFQLNGLLTAAGDTLAKPTGQSTARWQVMAAAEFAPMTVAETSRALHLTRQSVQRIADILVAEGLATYEDNPRHRRAKLLVLTERGATILREIQAAQRVWADELGAAAGEADLRRAGAVLDRLVALLASRG
jgi:DNA-binding MarR family transcriptional regulator